MTAEHRNVLFERLRSWCVGRNRFWLADGEVHDRWCAVMARRGSVTRY